MKTTLLFLSVILFAATANAQVLGGKYIQASYYDINGQKVEGLIRSGTGKKPIPNEGYITFKEDPKAEPQNLSASMIHGFVIGTDSFTVAHAPKVGDWSGNELDFVQVMVNNNPTKLYGMNAKGGRGGGSGIQPGISTGLGMGGFGSGVGMGLSLGSGMFGGGSGGGSKIVYYYGADVNNMTQLNKKNFVDVMSEMLDDQPEVVEKIKAKKYKIGDMDDLLTEYFKKREAAAGE